MLQGKKSKLSFYFAGKQSNNKIISSFILLALWPFFFGADWIYASSLSKAEQEFQNKNYKAAEEAYLKAEIKEPEEERHAYNRALSQYKLGKFSEAVQGFAKSSKSQDKKIAQSSLFNMGNSLAKSGQLQAAVKAYQDALKINAEDKQAKENLSWVKKIIKKQKKQQQQEIKTKRR